MKNSDWPLAVVLCTLIISITTCTALVEWETTNYYDVQLECVKQTNNKYCKK